MGSLQFEVELHLMMFDYAFGFGLTLNQTLAWSSNYCCNIQHLILILRIWVGEYRREGNICVTPQHENLEDS